MNVPWGGILFLVGGWFLLPLFVAKLLVRADWTSIGIAYVIWVGLLAAFGLMTFLGGTRADESFGWSFLILPPFLTVLGVPIILLLLRWTGLR